MRCMSKAAPDAQFEIRVDGTVRSYRYHREDAIETARVLHVRYPGVRIRVTDLRDGSEVRFDKPT